MSWYFVLSLSPGGLLFSHERQGWSGSRGEGGGGELRGLEGGKTVVGMYYMREKSVFFCGGVGFRILIEWQQEREPLPLAGGFADSPAIPGMGPEDPAGDWAHQTCFHYLEQQLCSWRWWPG